MANQTVQFDFVLTIVSLG